MNSSWMRAVSPAFVCVSIMISASAVGQTPSQSPSPTAQWSKRMQELSSTMSELLPDISDDAAFTSKKNASRIERNSKRLSELAHDLKATRMPARPDADPSITLFAGLFAREAERAHSELKRGNREYARTVLRSLTGYCIACHSRSSGGKEFAGFSTDGPWVSKLDGIERAELFASTRRFDLALAEAEKVAADPAAQRLRPMDWERSVRLGIALAIRRKEDPSRALALAERVLQSPSAPSFLKSQAQGWKDSLLAWKAEPKRKAMTEEGMFAEATRLIALARTQQKYPADRRADVTYFRATAELHDLLTTVPQGAHAAEALYELGLAYQALRDLGLPELHEFYFGACIQRAPHSDTARECYRQLEESAYAAWSGSSGAHLPADVLAQLHEMEELAAPPKQPAQPK